MSNTELRTMSIDDALNHRSGALFVINNFVDNNSRTGDVVGEYRDTNAVGAPAQPFKIPASWIPQRISDMAPKEFFLEGSPDFLTAVRRRWVVIVDPNEAEEFLANDPDAQVEADRITLVIQGNQIGVTNLLQSLRGGGEKIDLSQVRNRSGTVKSQTSELIAAGPEDGQPQGSQDQGVAPQVMHIMQQPESDSSAVAKLNALKSIPNLTEADRKYIHMNTSDSNTLAWLNQLQEAAG